MTSTDERSDERRSDQCMFFTLSFIHSFTHPFNSQQSADNSSSCLSLCTGTFIVRHPLPPAIVKCQHTPLPQPQLQPKRIHIIMHNNLIGVLWVLVEDERAAVTHVEGEGGNTGSVRCDGGDLSWPIHRQFSAPQP